MFSKFRKYVTGKLDKRILSSFDEHRLESRISSLVEEGAKDLLREKIDKAWEEEFAEKGLREATAKHLKSAMRSAVRRELNSAAWDLNNYGEYREYTENPFSEWLDKTIKGEEFIDSIVERIKRKQL